MLLAAGALLGGLGAQAVQGQPLAPVTEDEAARLAAEAYVFGYPLVLMDVTRQVMTAAPKPGGRKAPVNHFLHAQAFPRPTDTSVVSPNADTLYSIAWLDLAKEPMVLSVPEMQNRYYLMQMLDAWTNVIASPGTRATGNGKGDFTIVGPGWTGVVPSGVKEVKSPTDMVWIIGRTQTNGKDDYAAVRAIQMQYKLTPLSAWGKDYNTPESVPVEEGVEQTIPPVEQLARMGATGFLARLSILMKANPAAAADAETVKRFAAIGVRPGKPFDRTALDPLVARGIDRGIRAGREQILAAAQQPLGKSVNNWSLSSAKVGRFGTDYASRAVVALVGLGANLPEDAVYPRATADAEGKPLTGANRYVICFPNGRLPPVGAFWSVTMYNAKQFFVDNPLNRYAIGDRDKLRFADDGSLTLLIQHESPGTDLESNWLPAPGGPFNLIMRLYWPKQAILDGTWNPPPVERVR
jgi:hypothetical protein